MFLSTIASGVEGLLLGAALPLAFAASPLAATSDEIKPWMIAAIAAGALLALILIIVAARKSRGPRGEDLREAMSAAKQEAAAKTGPIDGLSREGQNPAVVPPVVPAVAEKNKELQSSAAAKNGKKSRGKHAK